MNDKLAAFASFSSIIIGPLTVNYYGEIGLKDDQFTHVIFRNALSSETDSGDFQLKMSIDADRVDKTSFDILLLHRGGQSVLDDVWGVDPNEGEKSDTDLVIDLDKISTSSSQSGNISCDLPGNKHSSRKDLSSAKASSRVIRFLLCGVTKVGPVITRFYTDREGTSGGYSHIIIRNSRNSNRQLENFYQMLPLRFSQKRKVILDVFLICEFISPTSTLGSPEKPDVDGKGPDVISSPFFNKSPSVRITTKTTSVDNSSEKKTSAQASYSGDDISSCATKSLSREISQGFHHMNSPRLLFLRDKVNHLLASQIPHAYRKPASSPLYSIASSSNNSSNSAKKCPSPKASKSFYKPYIVGNYEQKASKENLPPREESSSSSSGSDIYSTRFLMDNALCYDESSSSDESLGKPKRSPNLEISCIDLPPPKKMKSEKYLRQPAIYDFKSSKPKGIFRRLSEDN